MNNFTRLLIINIIVIVALIGGGAAGYYYYDQATNYVKTDNAAVSGQAISIAAPASGKLVNWDASEGKTFDANDTIGNVETIGADGKSAKVAVKMPQKATIALNNTTKNAFAAAGAQLAQAYNLNELYITANVDENAIENVKAGQKVDLKLDAFPGTHFTGKVEKIGTATASTFSLIPSSNSNGNYTKVTQVVPVKISIDDYKGNDLLPGMNVTVKIHI
ncbi:HlyD family secretion protein [Sporolactobacillus terrae]|uniref:HlyD family secretion protein n=1 Tax=Sporolactobacillus terrae TaxID=269673 RepID=A0ABX5Q4B0_9BACL|nr:efflux RND transporter periplasmic adaptor subunit [Sporolactobacillus terrae]QAA21465.1 HlyD family secretion protein [Sporolactobacillus terrae]QAA24437.1 HlyD family secretion protein [Sporolactobacillus terrae]UAK16265.1 HlyD family efflux transporter periplasmic adaptor subunit [Sporolactobacillus terrae]